MTALPSFVAATKGVRVTLVEPGAVLSGFQAAAGYGEDVVNTFLVKFGPLLIGEDIADAIYHVRKPATPGTLSRVDADNVNWH